MNDTEYMFVKPDEERVRYLSERLSTLSNTCNDMKDVMNEIHKSNFSQRFWKLLLLENLAESIATRHSPRLVTYNTMMGRTFRSFFEIIPIHRF